MNEWKEATVGEIASGFLSGGTPDTSQSGFWDGDIPWITSKWLGKSLEITDGEKLISHEAVSRSATKIVPKDSIIFATRVGVGKVGINRIDLAINQDLAGVLIDNDEHDIKFLAYQLGIDSIQQYVAMNKRGATIKGITRECLARIRLNIPPLEEQRKISQVLSTVQRAIQAQERIIQITTELKKALMQKLFSEGLRGEPQKESEIGLVPDSWGVVKIKNHCIDSAFGPRFGSDLYAEDGNILTLRTTDMEDDGRINYNTAPLACIEHTKFRNHYLQVGDVIVSRSGTCGIASVFEGYSLPVLPGAFLIRLRMEETVQPMYLRHYINSPVGRPYVLQLAQGAIQKNISGTRLGELLFPLPTRAEQEEISSAVRSVDQSLVLHRHKLRAKRDLFSTLIHELMTAKSHVNLHTINGYNR